jgi:cytochrome c oxidase cbb3-type subunit 3
MQSSSRPRQVGLALVTALLIALVFWGAETSAQGPSQEQLQLGGRLYAENCAVCHGPNGQGRVGATLNKDWPSIRPDLRVQSVIVNGVPGSPMPAWSQEKGGPLTDEEIEALTLYILSWETGGLPEVDLTPTPTFTPRPPITPPPPVEGDPEQGAVLYARNCAVCHGPNGEGRVGATLNKSWPSIRADLRIETTIERGVPGSVMPAWGQAYGGPLAQGEIGDIVAYIQSWETPAQSVEVSATPTPTPSAFRGPLGVVVFLAAVLALALVAIVGALKRKA